MYSAKTNHQFQEAGETSDKSPQGYLFDRSLVFFYQFHQGFRQQGWQER